MGNKRLKALQQLQQHEQQVKREVLQEIRYPSEQKRVRKYPIWISVGLLAVIAFLLILTLKPDESVVTADGDIILHELKIDQLSTRTPYYFATAVEWTGAEAINVYTYDLLDEMGHSVRYEEHGIAIRAFDGDDSIVPGVYTSDDMIPSDDFENIVLQPNEQNIVLFEVIFDDEFDFSHDYTLKLVYDEHEEMFIEWTALSNFTLQTLDTMELINKIALTNEERESYENYKETKDRKVLSHLQPMSIMKLYYVAEIEGETRLQYDLYTKQEELVLWSYEEEQQFSPFDQLSAEDCVEEANRYASGQFIKSSEHEGTIQSFVDGVEVIFNMVKDEDIWAVSFLPIQ